MTILCATNIFYQFEICLFTIFRVKQVCFKVYYWLHNNILCGKYFLNPNKSISLPKLERYSHTFSSKYFNVSFFKTLIQPELIWVCVSYLFFSVKITICPNTICWIGYPLPTELKVPSPLIRFPLVRFLGSLVPLVYLLAALMIHCLNY